MPKVVTRIAPSPTGQMHIGTVRTALFNYLFAKQNGGIYFVRVEDTDKKRNEPRWVEAIWEDFEWYGLTPDKKYLQSEHLPRHRELLQKLIVEEKAYISKEPARDNPEETVEVVRLKNPGAKITFKDIIHGEVSFDTTELGDFVIARSIDDPLFHFAVVVDDADDEVTHVIRGEDHLSNTPRQILIQEALELPRPVYVHIPLILAPNRSKLSKRQHGASVENYRENGYIPEGILNYLALLGWNPGTNEELFSLEKLIERFSLDQLQKSGAIFDDVRLRWFNHEHLKRFSDVEYAKRLNDFMKNTGKQISHKLVSPLRERYQTLKEAADAIVAGEYDFPEQVYPTLDLLIQGAKTDTETVKKHLKKVAELLQTISDEDFTTEKIKAAIYDYASEEGRASVLWPLRIALSGREKSLDPFTYAYNIGKEKTLARIAQALQKL